MKFAPINISASGDNVIASAVAGRFFRILTYVLTSDTSLTFTWKSGSTSLSGEMSIGANGSIVSPFGPPSPLGLLGSLQTNYSEDLIINTSTNGNLTGHIVYIEVVV